jgi:hypothetical protein
MTQHAGISTPATACKAQRLLLVALTMLVGARGLKQESPECLRAEKPVQVRCRQPVVGCTNRGRLSAYHS